MVQSPEYPDLLWIPPASFTRGRQAGQPTKITIHYTAGREGGGSTDTDGAHYCQIRTDGTSAHYFVDADSVTQCVRTTDEAHTALEHGNDAAIHYELCGTAQTRAQWLDAVSRATIRNAAKQIARDMGKYDIPLIRLQGRQVRNVLAKGLCGHVDWTVGYPEDRGTHTDPGPQFPWDVLFSDIEEFLGGDMAISDEDVKRIAEAVLAAKFTEVPDAEWMQLDKAVTQIYRDQKALHAKVDVLDDKVDAIAVGSGIDPEGLRQIVTEELRADHLRAAAEGPPS